MIDSYGKAAVGIAILGGYAVWKAVSPLTIRQRQLALPGAPSGFDGIRVLHITDLHGRGGGRDAKLIGQFVQKQSIHLVAVTGDLVRKHNPRIEPSLRLLGHLAQKLPVLFVPGNHDYYWSDDPQILRRRVRAAGLIPLFNQSCTVELQVGERRERLAVVGVEDPYTGRADLTRAAQGVDASSSLLLTHSPELFPFAAEEGFPVVLSGHTHGGQVRVPFLGAPFIPGQPGLFPPYDWGEFRSDSSTMFISAGVGSSKLPIRLGTSPEVWLLTLRVADSHKIQTDEAADNELMRT